MPTAVTEKHPENVVIVCASHGEMILKKDQTAKFYDEKSKCAGLCPVCRHPVRSIYSCNRVKDYADTNK